MPDGDAIRHLELSGQGITGPLFIPPKTFEAELRMPVMDDFAPVSKAIAGMVAESDRSQLFDDKPFHGLATMGTLFSTLRLAPTRWCCRWDTPMPAVQLEATEIVAAEKKDNAPLAYCRRKPDSGVLEWAACIEKYLISVIINSASCL